MCMLYNITTSFANRIPGKTDDKSIKRKRQHPQDVVFCGILIYMDEKQFSSLLAPIMQQPDHEFFDHSCGLEYKVKKRGDRLNFKSDLRPQQLPCLLQTKQLCLYHKISDMDIGIKPYDAFKLVREKAYFIICWYEPRKPKVAYTIPPEKIKDLADSGAKSISEEEASKLSIYTFIV